MKKITTLALLCFFTACSQQHREESSSTATVTTDSITGAHTTSDTTQTLQAGLPFTGKKGFETRPGFSGTGTPHRYIEIMANGDVYFGFGQINQGDQTETEGRYYAGKYQRFMKCFFKEWDNETSYYEVTKDSIYEVDAANHRITSNDCCSPFDDDTTHLCGCQSSFE